MSRSQKSRSTSPISDEAKLGTGLIPVPFWLEETSGELSAVGAPGAPAALPEAPLAAAAACSAARFRAIGCRPVAAEEEELVPDLAEDSAGSFLILGTEQGPKVIRSSLMKSSGKVARTFRYPEVEPEFPADEELPALGPSRNSSTLSARVWLNQRRTSGSSLDR